MTGRLAPQCNFGAIHAKHARITAWRRLRGRNGMTWQKTKLHQTARVVFRKIDSFQRRGLTTLQKRQIAFCIRVMLVATELHSNPSMASFWKQIKGSLQVDCK